jgi:hypothetical protein
MRVRDHEPTLYLRPMKIKEFDPNYLRDGTEAMSEGDMRQAGARIS